MSNAYNINNFNNVKIVNIVNNVNNVNNMNDINKVNNVNNINCKSVKSATLAHHLRPIFGLVFFKKTTMARLYVALGVTVDLTPSNRFFDFARRLDKSLRLKGAIHHIS